jgi:hypothetical protein
VDLEGLDDLGASLSNTSPFLIFLTKLIKSDFETNKCRKLL